MVGFLHSDYSVRWMYISSETGALILTMYLQFHVGPDEVHIQQLARYELMRGDDIREKHKAVLARRDQIYAKGSKL